MALSRTIAAGVQHWRHLIKPAVADVLRRAAGYFTQILTGCAGLAVLMLAGGVEPTPVAATNAIWLSAWVTTLVIGLRWWASPPPKPGDEPSPVSRAWRRFRWRRGLPIKELERVAYHEVGHLIVHSMLKTIIPGSLTVELIDDYDWHHQGIIRAELYDAGSSQTLYLRGMKLLGGVACERYFKFPESIGHGTDMAHWQHVAVQYLVTVRPGGEWYFVEPHSEAEVRSNKRLLDDLQTKQFQDLDALFAVNEAWLREQASVLVKKRRLSHQHIQRALKSVVIPPWLSWCFP